MSNSQISADNNEKQSNTAKPNVILLGFFILGIGMLIIAGAYQVWEIVQDSPPSTNDGYTGSVYEPPVEISDFTLPASTGNDLSLSDLEGQYVLMFFGYTFCPDVCPTTLAEFRQVKSILGEEARNVTFLFISVDPERDTPDIVREYVEHFDADFIGMSGDDEILAEIGEPFGLFYQRWEEDGSNYPVDHTGRSFLLDPQGNLVMSFAYGTDATVIADGVRQMMRQ